MSTDGEVRALRMRVVQTSKPLLSVYDMCKAGQRVTFEITPDGQSYSFAEHIKSGKRTWFTLRNNVWDIDVSPIPYHEVSRSGMSDLARDLAPFNRQVNP